MIALEIIGWAFIAGCAFAAFISPAVMLVWFFSTDNKEGE